MQNILALFGAAFIVGMGFTLGLWLICKLLQWSPNLVQVIFDGDKKPHIERQKHEGKPRDLPR